MECSETGMTGCKRASRQNGCGRASAVEHEHGHSMRGDIRDGDASVRGSHIFVLPYVADGNLLLLGVAEIAPVRHNRSLLIAAVEEQKRKVATLQFTRPYFTIAILANAMPLSA